MNKNTLHSHSIDPGLQTRTITIFLFLFLASIMHAQQTLTPFQYGWDKARSDKERHEVIYKVQSEAVKTGARVDYSGIDTANIEISAGSPVIPLTDYNDFKGMVINVTNNSKHDYLFRHLEKSVPVTINKSQIDKGDYHTVEKLRKGEHLLCITDANMWGERKGYSDKVIRHDMVYVKDGHALNSTIMPYDNKWSSPVCTATTVRKEPFVIKNLIVNRRHDNRYKTYVIDLEGLYDVRLTNIIINTPNPGTFHGDQAIRITNCINVNMEDVTINGTYSQKERWGYGISMNNVTDFKAKNIIGKSLWGFFGNNCINRATLEDCDIYRWDIHHYGRDITLRNCTINNISNQYSSIYGTVTYDNCIFNACTPHIIDHSYNAYTKYTVIFKNCTVNADNKKARLFLFNRNDNIVNTRHELKKKYWPDVFIENMRINFKGRNSTTKTVKKKSYHNNRNIDNTVEEMLMH